MEAPAAALLLLVAANEVSPLVVEAAEPVADAVLLVGAVGCSLPRSVLKLSELVTLLLPPLLLLLLLGRPRNLCCK